MVIESGVHGSVDLRGLVLGNWGEGAAGGMRLTETDGGGKNDRAG
jgi:hypothetical protein